jgi:hypothetical protein
MLTWGRVLGGGESLVVCEEDLGGGDGRFWSVVGQLELELELLALLLVVVLVVVVPKPGSPDWTETHETETWQSSGSVFPGLGKTERRRGKALHWPSFAVSGWSMMAWNAPNGQVYSVKGFAGGATVRNFE